MAHIAVIGAGTWGKNLVRVVNQLGALAAVADPDPKTRRNLTAQNPGVPIMADLSEVLELGKIDGVVIATPAASHYGVVKKALEQDLHVFVEKPLTLDLAEGEELVALAEERQRVLMVGHLMLYHPGVKRMKELVKSGELGDLLYIYGQRVNLGQVRRDENAMWSLGPHDISVVLDLFEKSPVRVSAVGSCYIQGDLNIEDVVFLNLYFDDGRMANVHLSWLDPHKIRRLTLVGSRKMIVFDDMEATEKLKIYDKGVSGPFQAGEYDSYGDAITLRTGDILIPKIAMAEPLKLEVQHFLDCVENGTRPLTDGRNGLAVLKVLDAARQSLKEDGAPVYLEPA